MLRYDLEISGPGRAVDCEDMYGVSQVLELQKSLCYKTDGRNRFAAVNAQFSNVLEL